MIKVCLKKGVDSYINVLFFTKSVQTIQIEAIQKGRFSYLSGFFLPEHLDTATVFSFSICDTSFMFIISLVTAWFAGNDFLNRTMHNEIKVGYSRFSFQKIRDKIRI